MDNEPVLFEVTDRAVERANEYLPKVNRDDFEDEEDYIDEEVRNMADRFIYISAYHQAEKDIITQIREQVKQWMPEKTGDEHIYGERLAFNSVLHLLEEMEEE